MQRSGVLTDQFRHIGVRKRYVTRRVLGWPGSRPQRDKMVRPMTIQTVILVRPLSVDQPHQCYPNRAVAHFVGDGDGCGLVLVDDASAIVLGLGRNELA